MTTWKVVRFSGRKSHDPDKSISHTRSAGSPVNPASWPMSRVPSALRRSIVRGLPPDLFTSPNPAPGPSDSYPDRRFEFRGLVPFPASPRRQHRCPIRACDSSIPGTAGPTIDSYPERSVPRSTLANRRKSPRSLRVESLWNGPVLGGSRNRLRTAPLTSRHLTRLHSLGWEKTGRIAKEAKHSLRRSSRVPFDEYLTLS